MTTDEKVLWMFEQIHGPILGACSTELIYDDEENALGGGNKYESERTQSPYRLNSKVA